MSGEIARSSSADGLSPRVCVPSFAARRRFDLRDIFLWKSTTSGYHHFSRASRSKLLRKNDRNSIRKGRKLARFAS